MLAEPRLDDAGAELGAQVDRQVRQPELVGERAGAADGLGRAAAEAGVVGGIGPQLERDADRFLAGVAYEQRRDGRVHAAAHRHERAGGRVCEAGLRACGGAERAVQRVGGELGGVALGRAEAAELGGDLLGTDARGVQQGAVAQQRDHGAAGRDRGAAAGGVEACVGQPPVRVERKRDADQIAAGGSARGTRVRARGRVPAPVWSLQVFGEPRSLESPVECTGPRPRRCC